MNNNPNFVYAYARYYHSNILSYLKHYCGLITLIVSIQKSWRYFSRNVVVMSFPW